MTVLQKETSLEHVTVEGNLDFLITKLIYIYLILTCLSLAFFSLVPFHNILLFLFIYLFIFFYPLLMILILLTCSADLIGKISGIRGYIPKEL